MQLFLLALVVASADPSDLPPPPPVLGDLPADVAVEPPASPAVAPDVAPTTPPTTPPVPLSPSGKAHSARVPADTRSLAETGLDPWLIGGLQVLVPCGVDVLGAGLGALTTMVPVAPFLGCGLCAVPAIGGYLATWAGDRLGRQRAPAAGPMLAAYVPVVVGVGSLFFAFVAAYGGGFDSNLVPVALLATAGVTALSAIAVPAAYAFTAEPKKPWDSGVDPPGFFNAGHPPQPKQTAAAQPSVSPAPLLRAMLF